MHRLPQPPIARARLYSSGGRRSQAPRPEPTTSPHCIVLLLLLVVKVLRLVCVTGTERWLRQTEGCRIPAVCWVSIPLLVLFVDPPGIALLAGK